ncbi:CASP-like protein 1 [Bidens hawaiensis]|uniref:CASP-like protein 1 n=1 Tax=Bidens hawaiensis TaxID=980011 RepID=UPI00404951FE
MASIETAASHAALSMDVLLSEYRSCGPSFKKHAVVDMALRVFLFATALASVIVMVTSEETKQIPVAPGITISRTAKFSSSPPLVYHVAALSVAAFYSFITCVISILVMMKPCGNSKKLKFRLVILDSLLLGIMAAAMGATIGVAYITLKGTSHSENDKFCDTYGSYCFHFATAILMSFIVSITLLPLIWLSVYVLSKIARK